MLSDVELRQIECEFLRTQGRASGALAGTVVRLIDSIRTIRHRLELAEAVCEKLSQTSIGKDEWAETDEVDKLLWAWQDAAKGEK